MPVDTGFDLIPTLDSDGDGVVDADEVLLYGSDRSSADSNRDGIEDGTLVSAGWTPLDTLTSIASTASANGMSTGIAEGIQQVLDDPKAYALYDTVDLAAQRPGSQLIDSTSGSATLSLRVEHSDDLITWTDSGATAEAILPAASGKKLFRFNID